jgi:hypothetical protein
MNTKAIFTVVVLLAGVVVTGAIMGTQYVSACHGKQHGKPMVSSTSGSGGSSMPSSSGGAGGGGY